MSLFEEWNDLKSNVKGEMGKNKIGERGLADWDGHD